MWWEGGVRGPARRKLWSGSGTLGAVTGQGVGSRRGCWGGGGGGAGGCLLAPLLACLPSAPGFGVTHRCAPPAPTSSPQPLFHVSPSTSHVNEAWPPLTTKHPPSGTDFVYTEPFAFSATLSLSSQPPNFYVIRFLFFFAGFASTIWSVTNPRGLFCPEQLGAEPCFPPSDPKSHFCVGSGTCRVRAGERAGEQAGPPGKKPSGGGGGAREHSCARGQMWVPALAPGWGGGDLGSLFSAPVNGRKGTCGGCCKKELNERSAFLTQSGSLMEDSRPPGGTTPAGLQPHPRPQLSPAAPLQSYPQPQLSPAAPLTVTQLACELSSALLPEQGCRGNPRG